METDDWYMKVVEEFEQLEDEELYTDDCPRCVGTGEGIWDGEVCIRCCGSGKYVE